MFQYVVPTHIKLKQLIQCKVNVRDGVRALGCVWVCERTCCVCACDFYSHNHVCVRSDDIDI